MTNYSEASIIKDLLDKAGSIVILQADNPDGDSLASSLALEQILGDMGKEVHMYCGIDIASYLHYLPGWDRVTKELPAKFDVSIMVDNSSETLLEQLSKTDQKKWIASKPLIVIDHHQTNQLISYATVTCRPQAVATSEVIYELAKQLNWPLNQSAKEMLAVSILSDSLGLTSEGTSARSVYILAELVEGGVSIAKLENMRRDTMRKSQRVLHYKGDLLKRVEYSENGRIAFAAIPWAEIEEYSHEYNPSMLIIDEMRLTEGTDLAIVFKLYADGKITAKIRANAGHQIAGQLAEKFGGGGHPYASGFKITDRRSFDELKQAVLTTAQEILTANDAEKTSQ